jgi:thioredoxin-dependent peroxiredoxin
MQVVAGSALIRQQQQAEGHLRDQHSLHEREQVPRETTRFTPPRIGERAECASARADHEHERPDRVVQVDHGGRHYPYRYDRAVVADGTQAPDFELTTDEGNRVRLSDLRGQPVVLYFYPKDDTPGCTAQACEIRDEWSEFKRRGAVVLGVSPDDEASHAKFKSKHSLPFTLLADPDHRVADEYGVWGEREFAGRKYMGINRSTFVIDSEGRVAKALYGVKPHGHAEKVLAALD